MVTVRSWSCGAKTTKILMTMAKLKPCEWWHHILQIDRMAADIKNKASALVSVYRVCARNMSADPEVAQKMRLRHVRECHNCVIVLVAASAVRIINTCGYSGERGAILTGHKMEKTGKHIGRGEGRLLLFSCLCTETCFTKTLQPTESLIFSDNSKGQKQGSHFFFY